jgi:isoleucyl-tRNA synthetase
VRNEVLVHSYPFCERTDTPLIYKAISTWYVSVEKIKDRLVANNQTINWVPEHLRDGRMGKWLEGARDWAISRNRFWGTPIPIWQCDKHAEHLDVIGGVADLEKRSGTKVDDLHTHFVDKLSWKCTHSHCTGTMHRISEVFDCWFESGSMPYAQNHYPFENQERFKRRFPADFIAEGLDQTRGWFYTLAVLSGALFEKPAFKNVVVNGLVLAADGKKMSKRLKNYTAPELLLDRFGADSVRLYMLNSAVLKAGDLAFTDQGVRDTTRAVLLPLWNAYSFLSTYAAADGWQPTADLAKGVPPKVSGELDRWIISRFQTLCRRVHEQMELYRLYAVVPQVLDFIEDLTNWYIRLSRKRFWGTNAGAGDDDDQPSGPVAGGGGGDPDAYRTLYYVINGFTKVFAPFAPFIADRIYKNMTDGLAGLPDSVHLTDIPMPDATLVDQDLEARMDLMRRAANLGRSLRAKHHLKTRQVLPSMLVITRRPADSAAIEQGQAILRNELNVKAITFSTKEADFVRLGLKPNLKTLGRRLGSKLNEVRTYLAALSAKPDDVASLLARLEDHGKVDVLGHELTEEDFLIERGPKDERLIATEHGLTVLLDTKLTEELVHEGLARELVNRIQKLRKDSGLKVSDRIALDLQADGKLAVAAKAFGDYIARETLAQRFEVKDGGAPAPVPAAAHAGQFDIDGMACAIGLTVVHPA